MHTITMARKAQGAAPTLPVALAKLTTGIKAVSRAAVRRAILRPGEAEKPDVLRTPTVAIIVSGHARLAAAWCRGEAEAEALVADLPAPLAARWGAVEKALAELGERDG
jgi:hypothetical protein